MRPLLSITSIAGLPVLIMLGLVFYTSLEVAFDRSVVSAESRPAKVH